MALSCIYKIVNMQTQDLYVGSALNFRRRWLGHLRGLRSNKHHARYLQHAFNSYGESVFTFIVIEVIAPDLIHTLLEREQMWINRLKPAYNTMKDIKSHLGIKRSAETRSKIANALTGKHLSETTKSKLRAYWIGTKQSTELVTKRMIPMYKPILQFTRTGILIKEWPSSTHICRSLGLKPCRLWRYLKGYRGRRIFKNSIWRYKCTKMLT